MESVSIARTILVIIAYGVDVIIGLGLLGFAILLLEKLSILPNTWYPENLNIDSTKEQRKACWGSMTEEQKKKARKERVANILGYTTILAAYVFIAYLSIKYVFPGIIEMAKTI